MLSDCEYSCLRRKHPIFVAIHYAAEGLGSFCVDLFGAVLIAFRQALLCLPSSRRHSSSRGCHDCAQNLLHQYAVAWINDFCRPQSLQLTQQFCLPIKFSGQKIPGRQVSKSEPKALAISTDGSQEVVALRR